jgi:hypothetical protein
MPYNNGTITNFLCLYRWQVIIALNATKYFVKKFYFHAIQNSIRVALWLSCFHKVFLPNHAFNSYSSPVCDVVVVPKSKLFESISEAYGEILMLTLLCILDVGQRE